MFLQLFICTKVIILTLILFFLNPETSAQHKIINYNLSHKQKFPKQFLQDLFVKQTKLLTSTTTDSLRLQVTFYSLNRLSQEPAEFKHKADSLQQVVTDKSKILSKDNFPTTKIIKPNKQVKQAIPPSVIPTEIDQVITKLNQVNISLELPTQLNNIKSNLPDLPLPEKLPGLQALKKLPNVDGVTKLAKQEVVKEAESYFTQHQTELNRARAELTEYKGRLDKVESLKDLPKGMFRLNPLRDKPWYERVVLGSQWQFSKQERYRVDLGPSVAWLFTDKLSAGVGFQYRLSVSTKQKPWVSSSDKVFGYFVFGDYQIKKGFFGRLHYDVLNTSVPRLNPLQQTETIEQRWINGLSLGIGKSYTFYKKINGYALMQYNLLHQAGESPYLKPVQAKIGFYINGKHLIKSKQ